MEVYPFKHFLRKLKKSVQNKAMVDGSICNAYFVQEASYFFGHYFSDRVKSRQRKCSRNDDDSVVLNFNLNMISVFKFPGRSIGASVSRWIDEEEDHAVKTYVLLNCVEIKPYIVLYERELRQKNPLII